MVGCHHQLNGHEFEQTLGDSERSWSAAVHGVIESDIVTEKQQLHQTSSNGTSLPEEA